MIAHALATVATACAARARRGVAVAYGGAGHSSGAGHLNGTLGRCPATPDQSRAPVAVGGARVRPLGPRGPPAAR